MPINAQLSKQKTTDQIQSRRVLVKVMCSVAYLARQGLPLRGHNNDESNLAQLLELQSKDDPVLSNWLNRTTSFISPESQNEMLQLLSNAIVRQIVDCVAKESKQFSIIVDGTQDCSGKNRYALGMWTTNLMFVNHS